MTQRVTVGVAVMAHRKREAYIPELLASLDRPADVVWDTCDNRWDTGSRAMAASDPSFTHWLVLQDDAIVCGDLVAGLERALTHVPRPAPVALYAGRVRPFSDDIRRQVTSRPRRPAWLTMPDINWGVGIVVPTNVIPSMLEWCAERPEQNYDGRISAYFTQVLGERCWYTWPSLVDHRAGDSLIPGRTARRNALRFLGERRSALGVDWSRPHVNVDTVRPQHDAAMYGPVL